LNRKAFLKITALETFSVIFVLESPVSNITCSGPVCVLHLYLIHVHSQ